MERFLISGPELNGLHGVLRPVVGESEIILISTAYLSWRDLRQDN